MTELTYKEKMMALSDKVDEELTMPETIEKDTAEAADKSEENLKSMFDIIIEKGQVTSNDIDRWLAMYDKKVFAVLFDDDEYYIYKYLSRAEYKDILLQFKKASELVRTNEFLDELITEKCLLYPAYDKAFAAASPAGTITSLSKQIQYSSNFVPDAYLMSLIYKL